MDSKLVSERENSSLLDKNLNLIEKTFSGNNKRDLKDSNPRKENLDDQRNNGDSYSNKNNRENINIISDRYGIEGSSYMNSNSLGNKEERRNHDDYSHSNYNRKELNKYEVSKPMSNNNTNFGSSSKLDKSVKASDKIKFSNINNLEFFNQKYYN